MRPTDIPALQRPSAAGVDMLPPDLVDTTAAMASRITLRIPDHFGDGSEGARRRAAATGQLADALEIFHAVDRTCTRFREDSDLMRANGQPHEWVTVDPYCYEALREAHEAYRVTAGRFDPRVLDDLVRLGYARSFRLGVVQRTAGDARRARAPLSPWQLGLRADDNAVKVCDTPDNLPAPAVDLGGIGKGLAVRWASERLRGAGISDHIVEAGGDCFCSGHPGDGTRWRVGIEDPLGGDQPIAVLQVSDEAVTTSSVRLRHWRIGDDEVHHIIDPMTGRPGGQGILAVTVVDADPATAEVWAKVLFLCGIDGIEAEAQRRGLAALWVDEQGAIGTSSLLGDRLLWRRP